MKRTSLLLLLFAIVIHNLSAQTVNADFLKHFDLTRDKWVVEVCSHQSIRRTTSSIQLLDSPGGPSKGNVLH